MLWSLVSFAFLFVSIVGWCFVFCLLFCGLRVAMPFAFLYRLLNILLLLMLQKVEARNRRTIHPLRCRHASLRCWWPGMAMRRRRLVGILCFFQSFIVSQRDLMFNSLSAVQYGSTSFNPSSRHLIHWWPGSSPGKLLHCFCAVCPSIAIKQV